MRRLALLGLILALVNPPPPTRADDPAPQDGGSGWTRIEIPGHGALLLQVPDGWRMEDRRAKTSRLWFLPTAGNDFSMIITIFIETQPFDEKRSRNTTRMILEHDGKTSVDRHASIQELEDGPVRGFHTTYEMAKPSKGSPFQTAGIARLDEFQLSFNLFSNRRDEPAIAAALRMLETAKREPPALEEGRDVSSDLPSSGSAWKRIRIPDHGALLLLVPNEWSVSATGAETGCPVKMHLAPVSQTRGFRIEMTVCVKQAPPQKAEVATVLRRDVEDTRYLFTQSVENRRKPYREEAAGSVTVGSISGLDLAPTEPSYVAPNPETYRYLTIAAASLDEIVLHVLVRSDDREEPQAAATLQMLKTARREPPEPGAVQEPKAGSAEPMAVTVSLPEKPWALSLDLAGFSLDSRQQLPDGSGSMMQASNRETGLIVSAFVETAKKETTVEGCKERYWKLAGKGPLKKTDIHEVVSGAMIAMHYMIPEFRGIPARQKNINAYLYHDGACIDIHISKTGYETKDDPLFDAVLSSARFVEGH